MAINTYLNNTYLGYPIGLAVRGQIGKAKIFRIRPGNGYYDTKIGDVYQDCYNYFVPSSINNPESEPYRVQWKAAVIKWQYDLTEEKKQEYNLRASRGMHMSGYNLFMREAMKGEVQMFVDRGDPASYDFVKTDLTIDGAWHDLDLSAIVPAGAAAVHIMGHVEGANVNWNIIFRKKGNTNEINHGAFSTLRAGVERHRSSITAIDVNRVIQYKADNVAWTTLDLVVRGWWT